MEITLKRCAHQRSYREYSPVGHVAYSHRPAAVCNLLNASASIISCKSCILRPAFSRATYHKDINGHGESGVKDRDEMDHTHTSTLSTIMVSKQRHP